MVVVTYEGIVENGRVRLLDGVLLPENAKVYVVIPEMKMEPQTVHIRSPRLADPSQAEQFIIMEVTEEESGREKGIGN